MRNFLSTVIGIPDSTGGDIHERRDAVRSQGMETIDDLIEFDDDDVKILCASVRKPGGTIDDPNDAARTIPNPGHSISAISEKRLKLAMRGDFESAADFLLLNAPAPKDIERSYRVSATVLGDISEGKGEGRNKINKNDGIGKTGVELRYHSKSEYQKLGGAQKKELHEWRLNKKGAGGGGNSNDEKYKSRISSLETQLKELLEFNKDMHTKICSLSTNQDTSEDNANRRGPLTNPLNQQS